MTQNGRNICGDSRLADTEAAYRQRASSPLSWFMTLVALAALVCGGCQSPLPPLPNPPGPKTAVRLSPGDVIKASYADENVQDITEKVRRDGKISLPLIGELTAAGKRLMELQNEIKSRYEGRLD